MDKRLHFGWFVAWGRINLGLSQEDFAERVGMTGRNVSRIEKQEEPSSYATSLQAISKTLGYGDAQEFDRAWRTTLVSEPPKRKMDPLRSISHVIEMFTRRPLVEQEKVIDMLTPEAVTVLRKLLIVARGQGITSGLGARQQE